jgi:prephenate dehydrogenase
MKAQTVTIIGLDRIGGSIGMAIRARDVGLTVVGHDAQRSNGKKALEMGAVDEMNRNLVNAATAADILVLNLPITELEGTLKAIGPDVQEHTLVMDLADLKEPGKAWSEQYLEQGHYIGATPVVAADALADGRTGIEAARGDLFTGSLFCIIAAASVEPMAIETAKNFGSILGAAPYFLGPEEYDSLMQGISTMPSLVAVATFLAVTQTSAWRDMLRFAGLPFSLSISSLEKSDLAALALHDREASLRWLDAVLAELQTVRRWVAEGDEERLSLILDDLALKREKWLLTRRDIGQADDDKIPDLSDFSFTRQLFGFGGGRKDKKS